MIKRILYASDLGLYGPYMMQHVATLAEHYAAKIVVVHAIEPLGIFAGALLETYVEPEMVKDLKDRGLGEVMKTIRDQVMDAFEDEFQQGVIDKTCIEDVVVKRGSPAEVILTEAEQRSVDLIVIGSHSGGDEHATMLGSVASKILQLSHVPVYMVPMIKHRSLGGSPLFRY